jgi:predicted site-specific integrase-resolvase
MNQEQNLTIQQIADAVGFSDVAIREWCRRNWITCEKCKRGRWLIPYDEYKKAVMLAIKLYWPFYWSALP